MRARGEDPDAFKNMEEEEMNSEKDTSSIPVQRANQNRNDTPFDDEEAFMDMEQQMLDEYLESQETSKPQSTPKPAEVAPTSTFDFDADDDLFETVDLVRSIFPFRCLSLDFFCIFSLFLQYGCFGGDTICPLYFTHLCFLFICSSTIGGAHCRQPTHLVCSSSPPRRRSGDRVTEQCERQQ